MSDGKRVTALEVVCGIGVCDGEGGEGGEHGKESEDAHGRAACVLWLSERCRGRRVERGPPFAGLPLIKSDGGKGAAGA